MAYKEIAEKVSIDKNMKGEKVKKSKSIRDEVNGHITKAEKIIKNVEQGIFPGKYG